MAHNSCGEQEEQECANNIICTLVFGKWTNDKTRTDLLSRKLLFGIRAVIEHVHSFSVCAWPPSSSKAVITCGHNARFEFRNVSTVTLSGLEFVGCIENHLKLIGQFQLELEFRIWSGNGQQYSTEYRRKHCTVTQSSVHDTIRFCCYCNSTTTLLSIQLHWISSDNFSRG